MIQAWILGNASWFYILTVAIIPAGGHLRGGQPLRQYQAGAGPQRARLPRYHLVRHAVLDRHGIGLMFFGVAEPVMHFIDPPVGEGRHRAGGARGHEDHFLPLGPARLGHLCQRGAGPGLLLFRHGLPLTLRSALYPLIGERIYGPIGHAVDIFAIIGTVFRRGDVAGPGVAQINSGLNHLFGVPVGIPTQIILIVISCGLATISVASGLDQGIRILSETNLLLAVVLLLFVLVLGPTVFLLQTFVQNTGAYLSDIVNKTFNLYAYEPTDWIGGWICSTGAGGLRGRPSWACSSRGSRAGAPSASSWAGIAGSRRFHPVLDDGVRRCRHPRHPGRRHGQPRRDRQGRQFAGLVRLPGAPALGSVTSVVAIVMVVVFFVTSADSGALVVDRWPPGGAESTPVWQRIFWSTPDGRESPSRCCWPTACRRYRRPPSPARCRFRSFCCWPCGGCSRRSGWTPPSAACFIAPSRAPSRCAARTGSTACATS